MKPIRPTTKSFEKFSTICISETATPALLKTPIADFATPLCRDAGTHERLEINYPSYLRRRSPCHARAKETLEGHLELLRCYYNFVRPHRALKFGRETRTPAMQAGLTTSRVTFREIFATTIHLWSRVEMFLLTGTRIPVSPARVPLPAAA